VAALRDEIIVIHRLVAIRWAVEVNVESDFTDRSLGRLKPRTGDFALGLGDEAIADMLSD
jgi:hypothetical protein